MIIDTAEDAHLYPPFGNCQTWPPNPTYYPCESASSVATWGDVTLGTAPSGHVVDGVISPGEYDCGMAVELVADPSWTVDAYIDWDSQYMYVAVDEPAPDYIEFAFDAGSARDRVDLFTLWTSGLSSYRYCMKSGGGWTGDLSYTDFLAVSGIAKEFKFNYNYFGIALGDTIKMCIERGYTPNAYWPAGGNIWNPSPAPTTWGDVMLDATPCGTSPSPPTANFIFNPPLPTDLDLIQFTDTSTDDGTLISWSWDFGDGGTSTDQNPTHQYTHGGTYSVTLTVTDNDGASASISKDVVVISVDQGQTKCTNNFAIFSAYSGAQSFKPTVTKLTYIEVFMRKVGNPSGDVVLSVRSSLTGANLISLQKPASQIPTTNGWVKFDFSDLSVTPGNTYYLVLQTSGGSIFKYYSVGYSSGNLYKNGVLWTSITGGAPWYNNLGYDLCFKTYGFT
jgi:PKD repeat protein